jgi:hypothetical protein
MSDESVAGINWGIMDGLEVTEVFRLADGRIEINWKPVDRMIPDEIEYLSDRQTIPVSRTQMQAILRDAETHYLFSDDNLWRGIRCSKEFWGLFLRSRGYKDNDVTSFEENLKLAPEKKIIPKEVNA